MKSGIVVSLIGLSCCILACTENNGVTNKFYDFEALMSNQIVELSERKAKIYKYTYFDSKSFDTTFCPSIEDWELEFQIFHELEGINKLVSRNDILVHNRVNDDQSNLKINRIISESTNIKEVNIYYLNEIDRLRKIEAVILGENFFSRFERNLVMEFEEENGKIFLSFYGVNGYEKMILRDSVKFKIRNELVF